MTHYWKGINGWFKFKDAYDAILRALPSDRPSTFVELGTWYGRSAAYLGVEIVKSGKPVTLIAIDHFQGQPEIEQSNRAHLVSESEASCRRNLQPLAEALGPRFQLLVSKTVPAADRFADGSLDAVWVDAAHDYDGVKADLQAWWPKVKDGGFFGGDDFDKCVGVREAVHEVFTDRAAIAKTHYWMIRRAGAGVEYLA